MATIAALAILQGNASAAARSPEYSARSEVGVTPVTPPKTPEAVPATPIPAQVPPSPPEPQRISVAIGQSGYEPNVIVASVDEPIVMSVEQGEGCAAGFLIPVLGVSEDNSAGPVTIDLGIVAAGRYQFSCGMGMVTGELVVR